MAAGKTTFVLEADAAKAVNAFLKVIDAQGKAVDGMRKMSREGRMVSKTNDDIGRSMMSWVAGIASIATLKRSFKAFVDEMERAKNLRKEMGETTLTVERLALKIAQLRRDVTSGGVTAVTKDMERISKQAAVSLEVASKSLFYAESAMGAGTGRAKTAAMAISRFAGPAGLTPEETMLIPKLFDIMKADTEKKQMQVLNQINAATRASIAETGEFIQPFMKPLVADIQRGFTLPQSLARMVAAVQVTGSVEEAGTISATGLDIAAGRTEKALKYYRRQARKRGLDYGTMSDPERYEFARSLYEEAETGGPGAMDVLKTTVGTKGFRAIRALFGETGKRKYSEVLPEIEKAVGATDVEQMAGQYLGLITAESTRQAVRAQTGAARIGQITRPQIMLEDMVTEILKQSKATARGYGETLGWGMMPESIEKHKIAGMLISANLNIASKIARGPKEQGEIQNLLNQLQLIESFRLNPEFVERAYQATEGFTLPGKYGTPRYEPARPTFGMPNMRRGMDAYFGLTEETGKENARALKENTDAINRLADKMPDRIVSVPLSPGMVD